MIEKIVTISGAITAIAAAFYVLYKLYFWWSPITIEPFYSLNMDGTKLDAMGAKITNRSQSTLYLRSCVVRGTYSFKNILSRHLRNPLLAPRLYPNIWYNGAVYELLKETPLKIDPHQLIELKYEIYEHPLNAMYTPFFLVKAELTSRKVITSNKIGAPKRWRFIGLKTE